MSKLINKLFSHKKETENVILRALKSSGKGRPKTLVSSNLDIENFVEENKDQYNIYFGVCTSFTDKQDKKSIANAYALWCDIDQVISIEDLEFPLPPSIVISSGNGVHCYWILNTPSNDFDRVEELNKDLIMLLGGDVGTHERTRLLRVEGTLNHKDKTNLKPVEIVYETSATYSLDDLEAAIQLSDLITEIIISGSTEGYASRSERDYAVINACIIEGMSDKAIKYIFEYQPVGDRVKDKGKNGQKYLSGSISKARSDKGLSIDNSSNTPSKKLKTVNGLKELHNCYWVEGKQSKKVSTFILRPNFILRSNDKYVSDVISCDVYSETNNKPIPLNISKDSLTSIRGLLSVLPHANWQWLGNDTEVRKVLPFLMAQLSTDSIKISTTQLGFLNGVWVGTRDLMTSTGEIKNYDSGNSDIVYLKRKGISLETGFNTTYHDDLPEFITSVLNINTANVIAPVLGWTIASLFKSRLSELGLRFPFLNVFGTQGSGKTTTIHKVVQSLTGYTKPSSTDCNTTLFSLLNLFGYTTDVPIYLSEYRKVLSKSGSNLHRLLLLGYDNGEDYRGKADQTLERYPLTSPIVIDGNDYITEPALLERIIQVRFYKDTLRNKEYATNLKELEKFDFSSISTYIIQKTLSLSKDLILELFTKAEKIFSLAFSHIKLDLRVIHNHSIALFGLLVLFNIAGLDFNLDTKSVFETSIENITSSTGATQMEFDLFIEDFIAAFYSHEIINYDGAIHKLDKENNIIWFNLKGCASWWEKFQSKKGDQIDIKSVKAQHKERIGEESDQYILPSKNVSINGVIYWCAGIDLKKASSVIEVPYKE